MNGFGLFIASWLLSLSGVFLFKNPLTKIFAVFVIFTIFSSTNILIAQAVLAT